MIIDEKFRNRIYSSIMKPLVLEAIEKEKERLKNK